MYRALPSLAVLSTALAYLPVGAAEPGPAAHDAMVLGDPGLVAYWRLETDLGEARGGPRGEAGKGPAAFVPGGPVKGIALAGGRFVTFGPTPDLDLEDQTVEMWFRPDFQGAPYNPCLLAKRRTSGETRFSLHVMNDYATLAVWNGREVTLFEPQGTALRRGEWHHLVLVRSAAGLALYLDGVACAASSPGSFSLERKGLPLTVGASVPEGAEAFEGAIARVAIYRRALSADDAARHMDALGAKKRRSPEEIRAEAERARRELSAAAEARLAPHLSDEALFGPGETTVYRGERLEAIRLSVGGVGAGSIQVDGKGERPVWQIFGNMSQCAIPDSFFAVRAKAAGGAPVLRALQSTPVGPFGAMKDLSFRGEFPFGWFSFDDPALPVEASLETYNPLIPLDLKASSIPCAIFTVALRNRGTEPVEATVLAAQQNAVGCGGAEVKGRTAPGYGASRNRIIAAGGSAILHMTSDWGKGAPGSGDMALAAMGAGATGRAEWETLEALAEDIAADGLLSGPAEAGPTPAGRTIDGALAVPFRIPAGATIRATFILAWHFPDVRYGAGTWGGRGNMYENWYPDALAVARDVLARQDDLYRRTALFHRTFYASNLPRWLLDRISSQLVVLRSATCFWTKDGYFGGWEGVGGGGGCCQGNCNHVWQYAQAHARVFPELGRIFRDQDYRFQAPDGGLPHRQPSEFPAFDGQCGGILATYREYCLSADRAWLDGIWPKARKAMDYTVARWDADEDGVLAGPQWNTLDGNLGGSTTWLGSLYLAALAASERMAAIEGDGAAAARYRKVRESGSRKQDETLFQGSYYIQIPDKEPQQDYGRGCHIDQLLGQWWAHQLDLGALYPEGHLRSAMTSLFRNNFQKHFHGIRQLPRRFVADDDPGMQMITWPSGGKPAGHTQYASEVMSGFEYSAAAEMVHLGLLREGFTVLRGAWLRYDGRMRRGVEAWGWNGNPFCDDECGKFYARPMSIWSVLIAAQGFTCEGPAGRIGFRPVWKPEGHATFFAASEGWGLFRQERTGGGQEETIDLVAGKLTVRELVFEVPQGKRPSAAKVRSGGREIPSSLEAAGRDARIRLEKAETLAAPGSISITISY